MRKSQNSLPFRFGFFWCFRLFGSFRFFGFTGSPFLLTDNFILVIEVLLIRILKSSTLIYDTLKKIETNIQQFMNINNQIKNEPDSSRQGQAQELWTLVFGLGTSFDNVLLELGEISCVLPLAVHLDSGPLPNTQRGVLGASI